MTKEGILSNFMDPKDRASHGACTCAARVIPSFDILEFEGGNRQMFYRLIVSEANYIIGERRWKIYL